jgi:hypothetical protein
MTSFTANSKSYVVAASPLVTVKLRRVNNPNVTGNRMILYSEFTGATATACVTPRQLDFKAPYNDDMASFLNNNILNHGTDNIFTNASNGDDNNNNIERVDVIFNAGIASSYPADAGFLLCERGNNNAHDGFRIAAILSINGSGDPTSFGAVKTCVTGNGSNNGSWGHPSTANGNKVLAAYVLRKDPADTYLRVSSNVNQEIGGVFFSLSDLGVAANQVFYGYALIGPDGTANPSSAQLLNTSDAAIYPLGTTEAQGGGLDLISINTFYGTNQALSQNGLRFFKGIINTTSALLSWELDEFYPGTSVILERADDGNSYLQVYQYLYQTGEGTKTFRDDPSTGSWFYRLKFIHPDGPITYGPVVHLQSQDKDEWKIYPNATRPGNTLTIEGLPDGTYQVRLYGILVNAFKFQVNIQGGTGSLVLPPGMTTGLYYLRIEKSGQPVGKVQRIIIRNL